MKKKPRKNQIAKTATREETIERLKETTSQKCDKYYKHFIF